MPISSALRSGLFLQNGHSFVVQKTPILTISSWHYVSFFTPSICTPLFFIQMSELATVANRSSVAKQSEGSKKIRVYDDMKHLRNNQSQLKVSSFPSSFTLLFNYTFQRMVGFIKQYIEFFFVCLSACFVSHQTLATADILD